MSEFIKNENTSWEVLSDKIAVKSTDLSALKYNEIRVTNEVKEYFFLENMEKHERREIFLHYNGIVYPCVLYLDSYDKGRGKLRWGKKFRNVFTDLVSGYFFDGSDNVNPPLLRFYKKDYLNYDICFIFIREIIENSIEVDERITDEAQRYKIYENNFMWRIETFKMHGTDCLVCGFDYMSVYGDAGKGRCEVHLKNHICQENFMPDVKTDLIPVCSNCHDIIHAGRESDELTSIVKISREMKKFIR